MFVPARSRSSGEYFARLDHMYPHFTHASQRGTTGSRCSTSGWWQRGHSGSGGWTNLSDKTGGSGGNVIDAYQEAYQPPRGRRRRATKSPTARVNRERSSIKHDRSSISSTSFALFNSGGGRCRIAVQKERACDAGDDHDQAYRSRARYVAGLAAGRTDVQPQGRCCARAGFERVCNRGTAVGRTTQSVARGLTRASANGLSVR
jgi:hypothetical protein